MPEGRQNCCNRTNLVAHEVVDGTDPFVLGHCFPVVAPRSPRSRGLSSPTGPSVSDNGYPRRELTANLRDKCGTFDRPTRLLLWRRESPWPIRHAGAGGSGGRGERGEGTRRGAPCTGVAVRNLVGEHPFALSVAGVGFAVLLVLVMAGIFVGTINQVTTYIDHSRNAVWVTQPGCRRCSAPCRGCRPMTGSVCCRYRDRLRRSDPGSAVGLRPPRRADGLLRAGYDTATGVGGPWAMAEGRAVAGPGEVVLDRFWPARTDYAWATPSRSSTAHSPSPDCPTRPRPSATSTHSSRCPMRRDFCVRVTGSPTSWFSPGPATPRTGGGGHSPVIARHGRHDLGGICPQQPRHHHLDGRKAAQDDDRHLHAGGRGVGRPRRVWTLTVEQSADFEVLRASECDRSNCVASY